MDGSAQDGAGGEVGGGSGEHCGHCGLMFSRLWVHRAVCYACEASLRQDGRCPYGAAAATAVAAGRQSKKDGGSCKGLPCFCPHQQRCCACEEWSCEQCGMHRCDGEGVLALVRRLGPACCGIVFDWDRTLCTTKAGAAPLVGKHSLQPELATLLEQACAGDSAVTGAPPCCVATRNSHGAQIEAFLAAKGIEGVPVHCVNAQGRTKADVAMEVLAANAASHPEGSAVAAAVGAVVLLVDDDLRELCDVAVDGVERLAVGSAGVRVHRVFFSQRDLG